MPISTTVLNQQLVLVGRLLSEWNRSGKKVPEGFEGTLRDYAWLHAQASVDEEIYIPNPWDSHVRPGNWSYNSDEPSTLAQSLAEEEPDTQSFIQEWMADQGCWGPRVYLRIYDEARENGGGI